MGRDSNKSGRARTGSVPDQCVVRDYMKPGDIGCLTYLHGTMYAKEYGYDQTFEAYVARGLADFVGAFNSETDRLWIAERDTQTVGSIAIVGQSKRTALLRWFFVHPDYRGRGIGRQLLSEALRFCREKKVRTVSLWTTSELRAAHHLYTRVEFKKTEELAHTIWGKTVIEERYELQL